MKRPTIYINTDDGETIAIVKCEVMAETSVEHLTGLLEVVRGCANELSVVFKAYAELGLIDHPKATKLGCYRQAESWLERRLKALGAAVEGRETEREKSQARHITRLLQRNQELRERLSQYEPVAA